MAAFLRRLGEGVLGNVLAVPVIALVAVSVVAVWAWLSRLPGPVILTIAILCFAGILAVVNQALALRDRARPNAHRESAQGTSSPLPFVPSLGPQLFQRDERWYLHIRIQNGAALPYRKCFAEVVSFREGSGTFVAGTPQRGEHLMWAAGNELREYVTFTALAGEELVVATWQGTDQGSLPANLDVPIGIGGAYRTIPARSYNVEIAVGSKAVDGVPALIGFRVAVKPDQYSKITIENMRELDAPEQQ